MSATRDRVQKTLQLWLSDTMAQLEVMAKTEHDVFIQGVQALVKPDLHPSARQQFLEQMKSAQTLDELDQLLKQRIDQVGEEQAIKEMRRIPKAV